MTNTESRKKVVIVTGANGLIGTPLVERLSDHFRVIGFDRETSPSHPLPMAECVQVDLTDDKSVRQAFDRVLAGYGEKIASVIHLAAFYDFSGKPSPLYEELTVRGTERMLHELHRFQVGQFVFSSSMLVYAPNDPNERMKEDWPLEPKWDYPKSKVETEKLIHQKHGKIPAVILRIAGVYTDQCNSIPIAHQVQRIYEQKLLGHLFPGDATHGQSFIHLEDLVDTLVKVVEKRNLLPEETTILLGESETLSYQKLQDAFGQLLYGKDWETRKIPKFVAKIGAWLENLVPGVDHFIKPWMIDLADDNYTLNIRRAQKLIDWKPKHSLRRTLPKMTASLKNDPAAWYYANKLNLPSRLKKTAQPAPKELHAR